MVQHAFLFSPGQWLGEGKIVLSMVDEELSFVTKWTIMPPDAEGKIECVQEIQIKGLADVMHNQFSIFDLSSNLFQIELENQSLGRVGGKGLIDDKVIAWEFRLSEVGFEGFELYEKQKDDTYNIRAEYASNDDFRTLIQGKLWKQAVTDQKS